VYLLTTWRVILDFSFADPIILAGRQCVPWAISGGSFMRNQIRKMLALVFSWSHEQLTVGQINKTFSNEWWELGKVPADGLFFDQDM
jgi:tRNA U38,U39,U40 pseudouridine synthase TruA